MEGHNKSEVHSLLARQLKRHLGESEVVPEPWRSLLDAVNEAYHQSDSDRRMLERSLDLSSGELLEANASMRTLIRELEAKHAEMEQFTYAVAHDLKGPVFTIQGFLEHLKDDVAAGDAERVDQHIERIRGAAAQMSQVLDELSELSRMGEAAHDPQPLELSEIVREAVGLIAGQVAERGADVEVAPDLPTVMGERPRLLRVFQNLIENAVKFVGDQSAPRVKVFARLDGGENVCCVRDNGAGIDPRHHHKIFGLFDRLSADTQGTGIGLAIVKRVVEAHGGRVWVESDGAGEGSTFCLTLPPA